MINYLTRSQAENAVITKINLDSVSPTQKTTDNRLSPKGADGFNSNLSNLLIAPAAIQAPIRQADLHDVIVANILVENASEEASLKNGFYNIKLQYENDVLVADLVLDGSIIKRAKTVRLIPTAAQPTQPEAFVIEVTSAVVFLAGVIAGMALVIYIQK